MNINCALCIIDISAEPLLNSLSHNYKPSHYQSRKSEPTILNLSILRLP